MRKDFYQSLLNIGAGSVLVNCSRFISIIIATRYLSVAEMGNYFLMMIIISILSVFASLGTRVSLVKFIAEEELYNQKKKIIFTVFSFYGISLIIVLLIGIAINLYFSIVDLTVWYILLFIFISLFDYSNVAFQGLKQFKKISISNAINGTIKVAFVAIMVVIFEKGFTGLLIALVISNFFAFLYQLYWLLKGTDLRETYRIDVNKAKQIALFSMPLYANQLYTILYDKGYSILLATLLDPTAVAYFNIATRIPALIEQFRQIYNTVFFPTILELIKDQISEARSLLQHSILIAFAIILTGSLIFYLFKSEIITLIFSSEYEVCSQAAFIMISRCALSFCGPLMGNTLIALGKNKIPLRINLMVTTLSFATSYFLLPIYGFMAVVYVALAASSLGFLLNWAYLQSSGMEIRIWTRLSPMLALFLFLVALIEKVS